MISIIHPLTVGNRWPRWLLSPARVARNQQFTLRLGILIGVIWCGVGAVMPVGAAALAVQGGIVHTMAGAAIRDGVVLINSAGKIQAVGPANTTRIPEGYRVLTAAVVTPGLIDAHSVVGLSGVLNQPQDQEQLEKSAPIQPELRAIDAYNNRDPLIDWVRSFGVTTLHTGHAPGALIAGQTMIIKTAPTDLGRAVVSSNAMVAATLGPGATGSAGGKAPGNASKAVAMLRTELLKARDYARRQGKGKKGDVGRDLRLETMAAVVEGKTPLLLTVHRHQDILSALRLASEFQLKIILDGVADAPLVLPEIKQAGVFVILHPTMARSQAEAENLGMETAAKLRQANIPFALQSGFESYVPKTRVVLLEAALAAANGLTFEQALGAITIDAARLLGVEARLGSLERGKDGDLALYDGDPFEYTSRCIGVVVSGSPVDGPVR
jgi:imidazolonepropionase-like amidohydrolase